MMRRVLAIGALVLAAAALALLLVDAGVLGRGSESGTSAVLLLAGDVRSDVRDVTAPAITFPVADYTVGVPTSQTAGASGPPAKPTRGAAPATPARTPVVAGLLTHVYASEGQRVATGQPIAQLDTRMLDLGVDQARTAARKARADVAVMSHNLDTLASNRAKLTSARAQLLTAQAKLLAGRAKLVAQIKLLEALIAKLPAGGPPPGVPPTATPVPPGPNPRVVLAQLKAALAKLDAGLAKMNAGFAQIAKGAATLADLRTQLRAARDLLRILADSKRVAVDLARVQRAQATVRAPVSGVVTFARRAGTVAMVGAPIVRIAADGPIRVDTYLTPEQLTLVRIGTRASIAYDSAPGRTFPGTVTDIADVSEFPPTSFPTNVVHMTRTVKATITLDPGGEAPAGTPVDVAIRTARGGR
jgi:X-X-X-Leu-X-X-Gly heptad repeat protein